MFRRYSPQKMLGILVILLAVLSYFCIDFYTREYSRTNKPANHGSGSIPLNSYNSKNPSIENINNTPNTEVDASKPENTTISPGAKIIMKKRFLKCGHVDSTEIDVPDNMVNLSEENLKLAYNDWKVEKFTPKEIIISKDVNSKCQYHYILKEKDGFVAVYYQTPIDGVSLKEVTPILINNLRLNDQNRLKSGLYIESQQELAQTLEDLGS